MPLDRSKILLDDDKKYLLDMYTIWKDIGGYIICERTKNKKKFRMSLYHLVIGGKPPKGMVVDHYNRNKLDNRIENLQVVTQSYNLTNNPKRNDSKQKYKGVQELPSGRFSAKTSGGSRLGTFDTPEQAYECYKNYINNIKFKNLLPCVH